MAVVKAIANNFTAFILAIIITCIPYKGVQLPFIDTVREDCSLTLELISDPHIETTELFRQGFLVCGLKNLSKACKPVDGVLVAGDLTNYGDDESLVRFYELTTKYSPVPVYSIPGNHDIGHVGDMNRTDMTREQARDNYVARRNQYTGSTAQAPYCSYDVKGYKVISLGDEVVDGGSWDTITMTQAQLDFLDRELAEGTAEGKPVFVLCHWPLYNTNGENIIWPGSGIPTSQSGDEYAYDIGLILEKYKNVYWISGHMHSGVASAEIADKYKISSAEKLNGVTYINLPTFGIINIFGLPWSCTGAQLEVYEDQVVFRPRNFITGNWYENAAMSFTLD